MLPAGCAFSTLHLASKKLLNVKTITAMNEEFKGHFIYRKICTRAISDLYFGEY